MLVRPSMKPQFFGYIFCGAAFHNTRHLARCSLQIRGNRDGNDARTDTMMRYNRGWPDTETVTKGHGFPRQTTREMPENPDFRRGLKESPAHTNASRKMPMSTSGSFDDPAGRELLAAISKIRRMSSGDSKYHSGQPKKVFDSPYLEFLDK